MADTPPTARELREASRVAGHLPSGYTAEFDPQDAVGEDASIATATAATTPPPVSGSASGSVNGSGSGEQADEPQSSLKLQGGDMHRDLFKMEARAKMPRRAQTFHHPAVSRSRATDDNHDDDGTMPVHDQLATGGFRRQFILQQQRNNFLVAKLPITRNFVEFLDLYGGFAGEDLYESDDEAVTEDDEIDDQRPSTAERRPLLGTRKSTRGARSATAGTWQTFFTTLKAFIGTGIMFLPQAFHNGGILFSSMTMLVVSAISMVAFHLLLQCKKHHGGGYGEIGLAIAGPRMRGLILGSITLSQLGFVCAGIVFVAENLESFFLAVTRDGAPPSATTLILLQLVILIPMSFIRNISKLGPAALIADVCILVGLTYIYYYDVSWLAAHGVNKSVMLFNPAHYTLTIGAAIFTFEGIGLILPIQSSMQKSERFEYLLGTVMLIITVIFTSVGALCYATFGDRTKIEVINNFPQDSKLVNAVQFLYSMAVLVGTPVQLYPALRILEGKLFGRRSGKRSAKTKWKKNAFRTLLVIVCGVVSIGGAANLDRFVALIGSVACVPLVYIYPAYLHYKGVAKTTRAKVGDGLLMVVGTVGMVYTTIITVVNSFM